MLGKNFDSELDEIFGSFQYNIHRGEFQIVLLQRAVEVGVIIKKNSKVITIKENSNRVMVELTTGIYIFFLK
jgi:flavin-dependent dehydrogenase